MGPPSLEWVARPAVHGAARLNNLPPQPTALLGREAELAAARRQLLLSDVRLLTFTGPAGVGKTRLALALAERLLDTFADGVFFVSLGPVSDAALVVTTIARALEIREAGARSLLQAVQEYLGQKQILLVLDNFEHLLEAASEIVELLQRCAGTKILVTSRVPLHLRWEHEFPVLPLALPASPSVDAALSSPAVALFVERAQAVRPDFALQPETAPMVTAICRRLDGLPLAIELAAARVRLLPPDALLARLTNRLKLLTGGARDLPARQQTLRDAIAWSHDLLGPYERVLFRRLAVFVGGCTLEAAEAVCGTAGTVDVFEGLASLVDKNLVQREEAGQAEVRFTLLETIREFALEQLEMSGEAETLRRRHAQFFLDLAEVAEARLRSKERTIWLDRLQRDYENLRAALAWTQSLPGDETISLRLAVALHMFWADREYLSEGRQWLEQALQHNGEGKRSVVRALAEGAAGHLALRQGDGDAAAKLIERGIAGLRELGATRELARALVHPAIVGWRSFSPERPACEEALMLATSAGDTAAVGDALHLLGHYAENDEDLSRALSLFEQSAALFRQLGDQWCLARPLHDLGRMAVRRGDCPAAKAFLQDALANAQQARDVWFSTVVLWTLGQVAIRDRGEEEAVGLFQQVLAIARSVGYRSLEIAVLEGLASVCNLRGQHTDAARLLGAAEAAQGANAESRAPVSGEPLFLHDLLKSVRARLDENAFTAAWNEGRGMSLEQGLASALEATGTRKPASSTMPAPARGGQPGGLTEREAEVLRLLAAGLTNQEIGRQLVLSPRTVESHIFHLYAKIGARGRADAAAYAIRHGLA